MSAVLDKPLFGFRPMKEPDLVDILLIEHNSYIFPWSETIFEDCLRVGYCCWVLEYEDSIIAYGVMSVAVGECHILNLCVKPEYQNNGWGQTMLQHLLEIACSHGAKVAFLEVRPSNEHAFNMYTNAGFNEVGMRRDYYPAEFGREDAKILARTLIS
jgi:ribosomal-protein-alanine N-acetyltransferase